MTFLNNFIKAHRPISRCIAFSLIVDTLDIVSSEICRYTPNVEELNPYMRDELHRFVLGHGLVVKGISFTITLLAAWGLYEAIRLISPRMAEIIVSNFIFIPAFILLMRVVLHNFILSTGWNVQ